MRAVGVGIKSSPDRIGALCDWSMVGGFQTLCTNQEEHMRTYKIAAMGGDGIGPEVVEAGVQVLGVCAERDGRFTLDFQDFDWGSEYYGTHGVMTE